MQLTPKRTRENFDRGWLFHLGDILNQYAIKAGMTSGLTDCAVLEDGIWTEIAYSDRAADGRLNPEEWRMVDLPHDWCVEGEFIHDDRLGAGNGLNGYLPAGVGCYRKEFQIPETDKGCKIALEFDGAFRNSTVWVNGHLLGTHRSGYTSFHYDLTDVLRYGGEGGNVVFVKVDARENEGWWYEGAGIYRHVWLVKTGRLHVARWGTYVTTPRVTPEAAEVRLRATVMNEYPVEKACEVVSSFVDADGEVVAAAASTLAVPTDSRVEVEQFVTIRDPRLWSPDTPYLYRVWTEIRAGGEAVDTYETPFGIRTIEFTADRGFFLNGKPLVIKGTANHQDFAGVGVALPDSLIEFKMRLLKEMGCNAYRSAHHPPTPELLEICDRLGLLVMDENRRLDSSPEALADLESMLYRDRNHPCIILWSMENEEALEGTAMGARILGTLARATRRIDPTRPVTAAMNHGRNEGGYSDLLDVVGYNYGHNGGADIADHGRVPGRKIIGSECAADTTTRGIYARDDEQGYCPAYGTFNPDWAGTAEKAWRDLVDHPFLTGVFVWTGFAYRGEPTPYKWPCVSSQFGIMDTCGFPKDLYHYYKSVWTDAPMVHIFPHWNWPGREGREIAVWAYSNCDSVELFLNGRSLGEKKMIPHSHPEWPVPYEPGELRAIARRGGKAAAEKLVATMGAPAAVRLEPDRASIRADGCDVSVVRVSIVDDLERIVPFAENEVTFTSEGPGMIIGVGNGNPSSHEPDKANRRRAFNGYCLAIVQAGCSPGRITLQGCSPGLRPAEVIIEAEKTSSGST